MPELTRTLNSNKEIATVFLKLGFTGFGGPAVHIAMMEEEIVRKRQWMSHEHFIDLIGATNLIPGPNSTEMALHCGQERGGWKGLLIAGASFILPAVFITGIFAWAYREYGTLPQVKPFIYGITPAVIGVVVSLMITLLGKALKTIELGFIGLVALILSLLGVSEIFILFGGGLLGMLLYYVKQRRTIFNTIIPLSLLALTGLPGNTSNWRLFWIFLKVGSILYGSGYVLFAFLDSELVKTGLLTRQALTDAIAVGQFTPGPVFSSATFIGWQIGGLKGAFEATAGIFLPSFVFVGFLNPLVARLRGSKVLSSFLDAVNVTAIALIMSVCCAMATTSVTDWKTIIILLLGLAITLTFKKLNSAFVILGGSVLGYLLYLI